MKVTVKQIEKELRFNGGSISEAAKALKVVYQTIWYQIEKSSRLKKVLAEVREIAEEIREEERKKYTDVAEDKLFEAVLRGEAWAVCFTLKCLGKDRGYVEKTTSVSKTGEPLRIKVTVGDEKN